MFTKIASPKGSRTAIGTIINEKKNELAKDFQKFADIEAELLMEGSPKIILYQRKEL